MPPPPPPPPPPPHLLELVGVTGLRDRLRADPAPYSWALDWYVCAVERLDAEVAAGRAGPDEARDVRAELREALARVRG